MHEEIKVHVPEGFGYQPQTLPVKDEDRFDEQDILVVPITEDDMIHVASGTQSLFPHSWWDKHEPPSRRPPPHERAALFTDRYRIWPKYPHYHAVKAQHAKTGEFMGFAGWHAPEHMNDVFTNMFRRSTNKMVAEKQDEKIGEEEERRVWSSIELDGWEEELGGYDEVRREEMRNGPHWFLAPFFVLPQYRGRGVGSALMLYCIDRADAHNPPLPCYLEALPNAKPVYYRYGFVDAKTDKPGREPVMIRPAKGGREGG